MNVCVPDGLEDMKEFLEIYVESLQYIKYVNIDEFTKYSRTIEFFINDQVYRIVWFINESRLFIGSSERSPFIMFRHLFLDTTFPIVGGNRCLSFQFTPKENISMFESPYGYSDFKLPI